MKKFILVFVMLGLAIMAFGQNAITTTTLTAQGSGWYRIATAHYTAINWEMVYTVGNSTSVTLIFARSHDGGPRLYYSERASDNTAENLTIILDDATPIWRTWWMEIPQNTDYVYVRVVFAAGNTGVFTFNGYLDYAQ